MFVLSLCECDDYTRTHVASEGFIWEQMLCDVVLPRDSLCILLPLLDTLDKRVQQETGPAKLECMEDNGLLQNKRKKEKFISLTLTTSERRSRFYPCL
jgi:hypothetical protein